MKLAGLFAALGLLIGCATVNTAHAAAPVASSFKGTPLAKGSINIIGDIEDETLGPAQKKFDQLVKAGEKTVMFRIDSPGGEVFTGMDFIRHIQDAKTYSGVTVQCAVVGKSMSMAFVILQAICDERYSVPGAMFLAHGTSTSGAEGKIDDFKSTITRMQMENDAIAEIIQSRLTISMDEYHAHVDHNDWFFANPEAFQVGAIDQMIAYKDVPKPYELEKPVEDPLKALMKLMGG